MGKNKKIENLKSKLEKWNGNERSWIVQAKVEKFGIRIGEMEFKRMKLEISSQRGKKLETVKKLERY